MLKSVLYYVFVFLIISNFYYTEANLKIEASLTPSYKDAMKLDDDP